MRLPSRPFFSRGCARLAVALGAAGALPASGAAAQVYNFTTYAAPEGVPQAQVLTMYQDRRSFIWFGTYGGLTRFDGVEFRTFTRREGLSSNAVNAIAEDAAGRLVVGTLGGGVCFREAGGFRCLGTDQGFPDPDVRHLLADPDGTVWVATEGGVVRVDLRGAIRAYTPADGLPGANVSRLARDGKGQLWVATDRGLARLEADRFVAEPSAGLAGASIVAMLDTPDGLLVGTATGLYRRQRGVFAALPAIDVAAGRPFTDAARGEAGTLWLATQFGVLRHSANETRLLTRANGLADDNVNHVMVDRERNVWFGTESGLSKLTPGPFSNFTTREGLPHPFVRAVHQDRLGRLWAGTRDGLARFEDGRFVSVGMPGVPDRRIYGIAPLPDGGLLLGTGKGLVHYRDGVRRVYHVRDGLPNDFVTSLLPDPGGGVWVGTAVGLARWDAGRLVRADDSLLSSLFATTMAYDTRGRLWIGRRTGGVTVVDDGRIRSLGLEEGLTDQSVWALAADSAGGMWVGTNGDGAFRVGPEGVIERLTTAHGLVNDFVWQVQIDRANRVWLFTSRGLDRWAGGHFVHFGRGNGLMELEGSAAASWEDENANLWFGTGEGLVRFEPRSERASRVPPLVYVGEATVGGRPLATDAATFRYGAGVMRIHYAAPTYRNPAGVRFRYRLLGGSDGWSEATAERSVAFVGLHPAAYVFEVEALGDDGQTSLAPAQFPFTVQPAFWQSWWFRGAVALILLGLAALVPWLRTRHLRRDHQRLERVVAEHTWTLAEQNRQLGCEVAERLAAEEALRRKEEQLRDVLEHSTNLFFSNTTDGILTYISPQSRQFFGVDPEWALGRLVTDFVTDHPANLAAREASRRAIGAGEKLAPYDVEVWGPDRQRLWVQVNEAPVVREGRTVAIVGALTDITEAKEARAAEGRLAAQLQQAQKMEAVGRLAGGIAHDFNNLLTAVIGHAELATDSLEAEAPAQADLAVIRRAADRAASLVAQLLAFSRQQMVRRRPLDLNVVAAEASRMLERILGSDIVLVPVLAADSPWLLADHGQLDQILLNLAVNARDSMPVGGRLTIATGSVRCHAPLAEDAPAGEYVVLEVTDTGEGMTAAVKAKVFEPFFTTKEVGKGTGLGLAMVYGIVKQNAGHVTVDSEPGRGSTFRLYFPRISAPAVGIGEPLAAVGATSARPGGDRVVLVVEDEDAVRRLVCETLSRSGYRVLKASDGRSALAVSQSFDEPIDLLLSDMIMPGMNGRQVAEQITERRAETRVLFMSGHADGVLGRNGLIEGADTQLIRKPFTTVELARRVEEVLAG